jgi:hypothetical protein
LLRGRSFFFSGGFHLIQLLANEIHIGRVRLGIEKRV